MAFAPLLRVVDKDAMTVDFFSRCVVSRYTGLDGDILTRMEVGFEQFCVVDEGKRLRTLRYEATLRGIPEFSMLPLDLEALRPARYACLKELRMLSRTHR
jgi:hypothetical protein